MSYIVRDRQMNARQAAEHFAYLVYRDRKVREMKLLPGPGTAYSFKLVGGVTTYIVKLHSDGWEIDVAEASRRRRTRSPSKPRLSR